MFKFILLATSLLFTTSLSADMQEAETLIAQAKCMECHNTADFKHRPKKVNSFKKLHSSVKACVYGTKTGWFDDEVMDVTRYLNEKHYHYEAPALEEE